MGCSGYEIFTVRLLMPLASTQVRYFLFVSPRPNGLGTHSTGLFQALTARTARPDLIISSVCFTAAFNCSSASGLGGMKTGSLVIIVRYSGPNACVFTQGGDHGSTSQVSM